MENYNKKYILNCSQEYGPDEFPFCEKHMFILENKLKEYSSTEFSYLCNLLLNDIRKSPIVKVAIGDFKLLLILLKKFGFNECTDDEDKVAVCNIEPYPDSEYTCKLSDFNLCNNEEMFDVLEKKIYDFDNLNKIFQLYMQYDKNSNTNDYGENILNNISKSIEKHFELKKKIKEYNQECEEEKKKTLQFFQNL